MDKINNLQLESIRSFDPDLPKESVDPKRGCFICRDIFCFTAQVCTKALFLGGKEVRQNFHYCLIGHARTWFTTMFRLLFTFWHAQYYVVLSLERWCEMLEDYFIPATWTKASQAGLRQNLKVWTMMLMMKITPETIETTMSTRIMAMPITTPQLTAPMVVVMSVVALMSSAVSLVEESGLHREFTLWQHATTALSHSHPTTGCTSTCENTARSARLPGETSTLPTGTRTITQTMATVAAAIATTRWATTTMPSTDSRMATKQAVMYQPIAITPTVAIPIIIAKTTVPTRATLCEVTEEAMTASTWAATYQSSENLVSLWRNCARIPEIDQSYWTTT